MLDAQRVRVYESGVVKDDVSGKMLAGAKSHRVTPETAKKFHEMHENKLQRALEEGLEEELENGGGLDWSAGVVSLVRAVKGIVLDGKNDAARVSGFKEIMNRLEKGQNNGSGGSGSGVSESSVLGQLQDILNKALEIKQIDAGRVADGE